MDHNTPAKAMVVRVEFRIMRTKESSVVVNVRTSSEMRWSGLSISPRTLM